jgi:protein-S-isoprenylcysteine O-methyltransferase
MPVSGSGNAQVKFLEAAACSKFFDATENGIEVPGDKKTVVFVEKQPGPNSVNDVIRNCAEGDASRCIRAYDADDDWEDMALLRIAKGKGKDKRDVDTIKRGKDRRGVSVQSLYH